MYTMLLECVILIEIIVIAYMITDLTDWSML